MLLWTGPRSSRHHTAHQAILISWGRVFNVFHIRYQLYCWPSVPGYGGPLALWYWGVGGGLHSCWHFFNKKHSVPEWSDFIRKLIMVCEVTWVNRCHVSGVFIGHMRLGKSQCQCQWRSVQINCSKWNNSTGGCSDVMWATSRFM